MSVVLIGPLSRCANCGRIPPVGQRWPHLAGGDWFCSLDCLYGLHPELEEAASESAAAADRSCREHIDSDWVSRAHARVELALVTA
jgi:hypothetical protein